MSDLRTSSDSESPQIVPGWKELMERLDSKDERIAELEEEVRQLESRLEELHENKHDESDGPTRAERLVGALRRTARSRDR